MICKITGEKIKPFMSFGKMPIANGFLRKENFKKEFVFNMEVGFSRRLCLFQLNDHPKPKLMFNKNYPFFTSSSKYMVSHFKDYSKWIKKNYFDKAKNIIETDIIIAANAICHIPNLKDLIKGVDILLNDKGIFVFEEPYLGSMYKKTSYDQIYDEHIYMFSVTSVKKIFNLFNFELIDLKKQATHGGSMRYVIARRGEYKVKKIVNRIIKYETRKNINNFKGCLKFKKKCEESKQRLKNKINQIIKKGKSIAGYAATSKSTTILNYCGIDHNHIDFICDTTQNKIGKYTPRTHIPIYNVDFFRNNIPDYTFLFAWNHKKEIFNKEKNIVKKTKWFAHIKL